MNKPLRCVCGHNTFHKKVRVARIWHSSIIIKDDGTVSTEGNGDSVRTVREPKTVRCENCGKRYPNTELSIATKGGRK